MKSRFVIALILTGLAVSGCGLYHWRKPNAGDDDFRRDASYCDGQHASAADAFNVCMRQRGWTLDE